MSFLTGLLGSIGGSILPGIMSAAPKILGSLGSGLIDTIGKVGG